MRKDPPFDIRYIYTTYLLEHAERAGVLVINKPQALRDANEKLFALSFPDCCPPSVVTSESKRLKAFWQEHREIVCKPLDSMGGRNIFRLQPGDHNANVIFDMLTQNETYPIIVQKFIPEIAKGDKRILFIHGEPFPHALVRIPEHGEWRGNLSQGARAVTQPLTDRDRWICDQVGPVLRERGLFFVGIDVIGEYLTEINVTSPTGICELDALCQTNISGILFDALSSLRGRAGI